MKDLTVERKAHLGVTKKERGSVENVSKTHCVNGVKNKNVRQIMGKIIHWLFVGNIAVKNHWLTLVMDYFLN